MYLHEAIEKARFYKKGILCNHELPYKLELGGEDDPGSVKLVHGSGHCDWTPNLSELVSEKWFVEGMEEKVEDLDLKHRVERLEEQLTDLRGCYIAELKNRLNNRYGFLSAMNTGNSLVSEPYWNMRRSDIL